MSPQNVSRDELVAGLVRVGELELTGEDEESVDAYFAPDFAFHGPDGAESDYEGLKRYFASLRAAGHHLPHVDLAGWLRRRAGPEPGESAGEARQGGP
jgi:hypothetical protein